MGFHRQCYVYDAMEAAEKVQEHTADLNFGLQI